MADGKTFLQCEGLRYTTSKGTRETYKVQELRKDLAAGHLRLKIFSQYDGIMRLHDMQQAQQDAMDEIGDFIETALHVTCGDDPTSVKEALARADGPEWSTAIWAEIHALQALKCWQIRPKADKESCWSGVKSNRCIRPLRRETV